MKKIIIILFVAICSCSSNNDVEEYLANVGINLADDYVVLENDSNSAFGESSKSFNLKVSEKDFNQIVAKIKLVKNYAELKENDFPNGFSEISKKDKIIAFKSGAKYFYNLTSSNTNEDYQVILIGQNKLSLTYSED